MSNLSPKAQQLLQHLASLLPKIVPGQPETYTGYKEVHLALGWEMISKDWGESLKIQGLVELADWTKAQGLPAITGIVVNQGSFLPGDGFFSMYGQDPMAFEWWRDEISRAKNFDWA